MRNSRHLLLCLAALAACEESTPALDANVTEEPTPQPGVTVIPPTVESELYQAIITSNGTELTVEYKPITAEQVRIDNELRASGSTALTVESQCTSFSLWLYDGPNATGNRVCFLGTGTITLTSLARTWSCSVFRCRPTSYWDLSSGTYWGGSNAGYFGVGPTVQIDAGTYSTLFYPVWVPQTTFNIGQQRLLSITQY